ncbi:MAG: methylated-DNA--[protein]-cysteine S-methyltransferase [Chloroflexota bacterium]
MTSEPTTLVAASVAASWGPLMVAATVRGVVAVELLADRDGFASALRQRLHQDLRWIEPGEHGRDGPQNRALTHLWAAIAFLSTSDPSVTPDGIPLDLEDRPDWDRAVLGAVRAIPRGGTRSYGDIARAIGRPGAARAVGGAVGRNPIALIIPCHRVIAADGTLGGYGGGWWGDRERLLGLKAELLALEGNRVRRRQSQPRSRL